MNKNLEVLDIISVISFYITILNYEENLKQTSNNQLFKELQKQDDIMSKQIINKLKIIESQNQKIIELLKGENNEIS